MTGRTPKPGDSAYYIVNIDVTPEQGPSMAIRDPSFDLGTVDFETTDVWLDVEVVDVDGSQATIEIFGEQRTVRVTKLRPTASSDADVYPTGRNSPYTSLEEIQDELRAERDRDD